MIAYYFNIIHNHCVCVYVGVGVKVGSESRINYLIVQVHYNFKLNNKSDNLSSYKITLTTQE